MAVFRILQGKARPGSVDRVAEMLVRQARDVADPAEGLVFAQALRSGDQVLAVSSWRSAEDMERYLDLPATQDFYRELPRLLMGVPTVGTYEVIGPDGGWAGGRGAQARSGEE
jgi:quinol monooxygenase YgiN